MMDHAWRKVTLKNKNREKTRLILETGQPQYQLICDFLNLEMPSFGEEICGCLEEMRHTGRQARFSGNRYSLAAGPERALVTIDAEDELLWCEIGTEDLRGLIAEWKEKSRGIQ